MTLAFKTLEIDGRASIATDLSDEEAFGIYAYEFTDGTWYVGKSEDVRKRHIGHMHEYRHEIPPRIPKQMLWAQVNGNSQQLDFAETEAISWFEQNGYSLRNVMKTGRPRGNIEVIVNAGEGFGVPIPWERKLRPQSKHTFMYAEDPSMMKRWERLRQHPAYGQIISILRRYVSQTIPAPADTAGKLWVATALPSTNDHTRLCCISCQNTETLVICRENTFGHENPHGFINIKRSDSGKMPRWQRFRKADYGTLKDCFRIEFRTLDKMEHKLHDKVTLDCCYRVNAELMRRGTTMYKRFNNPYLVRDILEKPM